MNRLRVFIGIGVIDSIQTDSFWCFAVLASDWTRNLFKLGHQIGGVRTGQNADETSGQNVGWVVFVVTDSAEGGEQGEHQSDQRCHRNQYPQHLDSRAPLVKVEDEEGAAVECQRRVAWRERQSRIADDRRIPGTHVVADIPRGAVRKLPIRLTHTQKMRSQSSWNSWRILNKNF